MTPFKRKAPPFVAAILAAMLAGCATVDITQSLGRANADTASFTKGNLSLAQSESQRAALQLTADELLSKPLTQDDAVWLVLINSPSMQALLAQHWADAAAAAALTSACNQTTGMCDPLPCGGRCGFDEKCEQTYTGEKCVSSKPVPMP